MSIQNTARLYYKFYRKTDDYNYDYNHDFFKEIENTLSRIESLLKDSVYTGDTTYRLVNNNEADKILYSAENIIKLESELVFLFSELTLPAINTNYYLSVQFELALNNKKYPYIELGIPKNEAVSDLLDSNGKLVKLELISHLIDYNYLREIIKQSYQLTIDILSLINKSWKNNRSYHHIENLINDDEYRYFLPIYTCGNQTLYCDERIQLKSEIRVDLPEPYLVIDQYQDPHNDHINK